MTWPNPWEYDQIFTMMRQSKSIEELERKARKAHRHKGKIWTQEDVDYHQAMMQMSEEEFDDYFLSFANEDN